jgi:predicted phosphodiesterase
MSEAVIDLLNRGRKANANDKFRRGNLISLPSKGSFIIAGDIHGHRRNFERIVTFADLKNNIERHVLLQEIIHGGPEDDRGGCLSFELLFDVIRYKLEFPDRVHLIMGNHDTAFINNSRVMKAGKEMNAAMRSALDRMFKEDSEKVKLTLKQFLFSQALAIRCSNRVWISHSLPADRFLDKFDPKIFDRQLKINDVVRPGSAYLLTWGRRMSQSYLDKIAHMLDVDVFILGHQPQSEGYHRVADNLLIIASDHDHGCLLNIDLARFYSMDELIHAIVPLASVS